jgi:hypothetical protein
VDELLASGRLLSDRAVIDVCAVVEDRARHLDFFIELFTSLLVLLGLEDREGLPAVLEGVLKSEVDPSARLAQLWWDDTLRHTTSLLGSSSSASARGDTSTTLFSRNEGLLHNLEQVSSLEGLESSQNGIHLYSVSCGLGFNGRSSRKGGHLGFLGFLGKLGKLGSLGD